MAEIIASHGNKRRRLPALRMDMTPLVDLAFLLLTFFILTTTLRRLEGLDLFTSSGKGGKPAENSITFLLAGRDSIYGYVGSFDADRTHPKRMGLDQVRMALAHIPDTTGLTLVMKPSASTRYAGVVDVLDEFVLAKLTHYAVADSMTTEERTAITVE